MSFNDTITFMQADVSNDYLFIGDAGGFISVWHIYDAIDDPMLALASYWRAHERSISSIDYVENPRILDTFLLTTCETGDISMWTLTGDHVGIFGQTAEWNLDDPISFRASAVSLIKPQFEFSRLVKDFFHDFFQCFSPSVKHM
jgi:hypothetical protein